MSNWYQLKSDEVLQQLGSDASFGLSTFEAARRLAKQGRNDTKFCLDTIL